jgi:hypothetical protein
VLQSALLAPKEPQIPHLRLAVALATTLLSACGTWIQDNIPDGDLGGTVSVDWTEEVAALHIEIAVARI